MNSASEAAPPAAPPRDRWYVLGVLTAVYALNIADRFSISTLIEPIRQELKLSDGGVAALTGVALGVFYVTIGIPVAAFADRANRRNILAVSLALWSAMTVACGLAVNSRSCCWRGSGSASAKRAARRPPPPSSPTNSRRRAARWR